LVRYIVRPQRRAKSQRITLPLELLKDKKWLKVDCYTLVDRGADFITLTPYSTAIITEDKQKRAKRYR
jgi:tricorn protease-like protein